MIPDKNPKANRFFNTKPSDDTDPEKQKRQIKAQCIPRLNRTETSQLLQKSWKDNFSDQAYNAFLCVKAAGDEGIIRPEIDELLNLAMCSTCALMNALENKGHVISQGKRKRVDGTGKLCKIYYLPEFL